MALRLMSKDNAGKVALLWALIHDHQAIVSRPLRWDVDVTLV
jgi:tRNA U34 5-carboxymethylaminomethyl modifying GTPase MnmE/TrmE